MNNVVCVVYCDELITCMKVLEYIHAIRYTFYDGPPFATGLPHYGHILAGTIKVSMYLYTCVCVCVCARACVRACVFKRYICMSKSVSL